MILFKISDGCFAIELCVLVILVNSASISAPYMQFVIEVWWTFYFEMFSFNCIDYFKCIRPERWDIVQIMQFLHIDLPKFRFTELGSKSAIQLNNNMHNFDKCQKEYVPVFLKRKW